MKIYIGPYKNWYGPYQLAETLCFWVKEVPDEHGFMSKPEWVHNFGTWLAGGDDKESLLYKFMLWIDSKRKRKVKIRIDKYDTWSMDSTLSYIILPMLKQLQATKHGSPHVDDEDVPEYLRSHMAQPKEYEWDIDSLHHMRWEWVMNELIWTFEQLQPDNDWEEQYYTGNHDTKMVPCEWDESGKPKLFKMEDGPNHTWKADWDGITAHNKRIESGLRLFGKYYRGLWD